MSFVNNSHDDHGQGPEARFRWEQHLLGFDDSVEDTNLHSNHEDKHDNTVDSENEVGHDGHHDDSPEPAEDPYQAPLLLDDPEPSEADDEIQTDIQRAHEPVLTFAFMPNHHGELYRTYRWTSTFIIVDVCIWVEPISDLCLFRGVTTSDFTAQVSAPMAGDIVRGFWVRPYDDLLMVGWGRVVSAADDQEIYLADVVSM
ncbi:hypothetical protein BJX65DRAFT_310377 [Aspergillus insuetus]